MKMKKGERYGQFELIERLGSGGNGDVWSCLDIKTEAHYAIKIFSRRTDAEKKQRFVDEVNIMKGINHKGVMSIIASNIDDSEPYYWYVMPIGIKLNEYVKGKSTIERAKIILNIGETLNFLHNDGKAHRDIKPDNVIVVDEFPVLSDFGLVHFEGKIEITKDGRDVGAHWTIAPEMKRIPSKANYKKADVYSFAKMIWIILTGIEYGFEGQYNPFIKNHNICKLVGISPNREFDEYLKLSTSDTPEERPDMYSGLKSIQVFIEKYDTEKEKSSTEWNLLCRELFNDNIPLIAEWSNCDDIVRVLNLVSKYKHINHTFFPRSGGLDLMGASISKESSCIELDFEVSAHVIMKPRKLLFNSFGILDSQWNYFYIENDGLEMQDPSLKGSDSYDEILTEIAPSVYSSIGVAESKLFRGKKIARHCRAVIRQVNGDFVIFAKSSKYNQMPETYDGRHNKMGSERFRIYIQKGYEAFNKIEPIKEKEAKYITDVRTKIIGRNLSCDEVQIIKQILEICETYDDSDDYYSVRGSDLESMIKAIEKENKKAPEQIKLEEYLKTLTKEQVAVVITVMYIGREHEQYAYDLEKQISYFINDSENIDTIMRKGIDSLRVYFKRALEYLS